MWKQEKYRKAFGFASHAHHGQLVPGTLLPYTNHVVLVAMEVMTAIAIEPVSDPDLAVQAALLHDTLEDTNVTFNDLESTFGVGVARVVAALTKDDNINDKYARMADSIERILSQPLEAAIVKMADRITNLQKPPDFWKNDKIKAYHQEALLIYNKLAHAHAFLAKRLEEKIKAYTAFFNE